MTTRTLAEVPLGAPARIAGFTDVPAGEEARLSALGLRVGGSITKLLKTPFRDPVECLVGTQLLAIDAQLLASILVETLG